MADPQLSEITYDELHLRLTFELSSKHDNESVFEMTNDLAELLTIFGFEVGSEDFSSKIDEEDTQITDLEVDTGLSLEAVDEENVGHSGRSINNILNIDKYHELGYRGKGIKIAILDSGLGNEYLKAIKS